MPRHSDLPFHTRHLPPWPNDHYQTPPTHSSHTEAHTEPRRYASYPWPPHTHAGLGQAPTTAPATHWRTEGPIPRTSTSAAYNTYPHPETPLAHSQHYLPYIPPQGIQGSDIGLTVPHHPRQWQHTYSYGPNNHLGARGSHEPHATSGTTRSSVPCVPAGSLGLPPLHIVPLVPPQVFPNRHALQLTEVQAGFPAPQHMLLTGNVSRCATGPTFPPANAREGGTLPSGDQTQSAHSQPPQTLLVDSTGEPIGAANADSPSGGRRVKKLNISTVKFHALGHYPKIIRHFGPTDLYSTEWVRPSSKKPCRIVCLQPYFFLGRILSQVS
jgi:hypothetical protein